MATLGMTIVFDSVLLAQGGIAYQQSMGSYPVSYATDPLPCSPGQSWWNTTDHVYKTCSQSGSLEIHATREWVQAQGYSTGGGSIPAGLVAISLSSCPTGFSEVAALDGKMLRGTLTAHGDVGTTGGSATITPTGSVSAPTFTGSAGTVPAETFTGTSSQSTSAVSAGTPAGTNSTVSFTPAGTNATVSFTPAGTIAWPVGVPTAALSWPAGVPTFTGSAGTVPAQTFTGSSATTSAVSGGTPAGTNSAPTFTGSALATHQHELPFQDPSAAGTTNFRGIASSTFGTGTSRAGVWGITTTSSTTSAAVAMSQAVSAGTPAGTVSAPTFTGSALGTHTHTLTATGTNGSVSFTPAGTIAWPVGVPTDALSWPAGVPTLSGSAGTVPAETFTGSAGTVPAETFTGSALGTHSHTITPSGTNSTAAFTPAGTNSAPTFTGNAVDPSPSYVKVIFCSKD